MVERFRIVSNDGFSFTIGNGCDLDLADVKALQEQMRRYSVGNPERETPERISTEMIAAVIDVKRIIGGKVVMPTIVRPKR